MKNLNLSWIILLTLIAVSFANYGLVLDNAFLGDDYSRIVVNEELNSLWASMRGRLGDRPLLMLSIFIDRQLFGIDAFKFRTVSVFLHALVSWQIYAIVIHLSGASRQAWKVAFLTSLIFAVHPLNNQVISIIIQRGVILATLFAMLSFRFFLKYLASQKKFNLSLSVIYLLLGVLSKPIVTFLPFFYAWLNYRGTFGKVKQRYLLTYVIIFLPVLYFYLYEMKNNQLNTLSPLFYFLVQMKVILHYLTKMFIPSNLSYLYDFPTPASLWDSGWLYLLVLITPLIVIRKWGKQKPYLLLFGFYLSFLPESSFFPIEHLAFDHRAYLPLGLFCCFIAFLLLEFQAERRKYFYPLSGLAVALLLYLNQVRNFEIKPYPHWLLNTLQNSFTYHDNNFAMTSKLIFIGFVEELSPVMDRFAHLYGDRWNYQVLRVAYDYETLPKKRESILLNMERILSVDNDAPFPRTWLNNYIIMKLRKGDSLKKNYYLEKIFYPQLSVLSRHPQIYSNFLKMYQSVARKILKDEKGKEFISSQDKMRIKDALKDYYGESTHDIETRGQ